MGIFQRISDIVSANLNEMAEGFENPEQMLKQAIREMEDSIALATKETAKALANEKMLRKELKHNESLAETWLERAQKSVESGDDDLAKKALKRKQEHDRLAAALTDQLQVAQDAAQSLRRQLEAMKAKLAEARRNLATLSARQRAAHFRKKMATVGAELAPEFDDEAFAKFDRLRDRVEQAEAEAEAMAELRGTPLAESEVEEVFQEDDEEEIEAMIAKMKKSS